MKILNFKEIAGANYWSQKHQHLTMMRLSIGEAERITTSEAKKIVHTLTQIIPEFNSGTRHQPPHSYIEKIWVPQSIANIAQALKARLGHPRMFSHVAETMNPNVFNVIIDHSEPVCGQNILLSAVRIFKALMDDRDISVQEELKEIASEALLNKFSSLSAAVLKKAEEKGIPYLFYPQSSLIHFGYGKTSVKYFGGTTESSSTIGTSITRDQTLLRSILFMSGAPVSRTYSIAHKSQIADAVDHTGLPAYARSKGRTYDRLQMLFTEEDILNAWRISRDEGSVFSLEQTEEGEFYKIVVIDYNNYHIYKRVPGKITGNGKDTVETLLSNLNTGTPRNLFFPEKEISEKAYEIKSFLSLNGIYSDDIPEKGKSYTFPKNSYFHFCYEKVAVKEVHPSWIELSARISLKLKLNLCAVNIISKRIHAGTDVNGQVVSVESSSDLNIEMINQLASESEISGLIFREIEAKTQNTIPVVAISGASKRKICDLVSFVLSNTGLKVNVVPEYNHNTTAEELDIRIPFNDMVLTDEELDVALVPVSATEFISEGFRFRNCDILVFADKTDQILVSDDAPFATISEVNHSIAEACNARILIYNSEEIELNSFQGESKLISYSASETRIVNQNISDGFENILIPAEHILTALGVDQNEMRKLIQVYVTQQKSSQAA